MRGALGPPSITARQPARMAIASLAVTAAAAARRCGLPEPFNAGVPNLRHALPLLKLSREQARRSIVLRSFANIIGRRLGAVHLPFINRSMHWIGRVLHLKLLYRFWLKRTLGDKEPGSLP